MARLKNEGRHHSDGPTKLGKSIAMSESDMWIAAMCVAAMWCAKMEE